METIPTSLQRLNITLYKHTDAFPWQNEHDQYTFLHWNRLQHSIQKELNGDDQLHNNNELFLPQ